MNEHHPIPATPPLQNWYHSQAEFTYTTAALAGLTFPGALIGALLAAGLWHVTREPLARRVVLGLTAALGILPLHSLVLGWFWRSVFAAVTSSPLPAAPSALLLSAATEILLGPLLLLTLYAGKEFRIRTALGHITHEHEMRRKRGSSPAMRLGFEPTVKTDDARTAQHPPGKIRLGTSQGFRRYFDLSIEEIGEHVFVPGASGSGKSNTLIRLADGALSNGYGVVIIDCKGVGLSRGARKLAERYDLPLNTVDPDDPEGLGYDACTGDPAHIANKLVGAFTFSAEAEIYQQVALGTVPLIARALIASKQPVTLSAIQTALGKGGLAKLSRIQGLDPQLSQRLFNRETVGGVGLAGREGMQERLGALLEGKFGPLFERRPALDWADVTDTPSVTYFPLSATAAGQDVELFGRVITQDLKQLCDARLREMHDGSDIAPTLVIYDEFAALQEPDQIVDLLLQARASRMSIVLGTQFLPQEIPIRTPILQAGTLICHRLAAADAEAIAAEIGTRDTSQFTAQVNLQSGDAEMGSVRDTKEYHIHPDALKELRIGMTAVYAHRSNRRQLVQVVLDQS